MSRTAIAPVRHVTAQPAAPSPAPTERARRFFAKPLVQDALIAGALTAIALVGVVTRTRVDIPEGSGEGIRRSLDSLGVTLLLLQTATLIWRRRAPVLVLAVVTVSLFAFSMLGYFMSFASFGFLIALYTVAAHRQRPISIPAGLACGVIVFLILSLGTRRSSPTR